MNEPLVFPQWMFLPVRDPSKKGPTAILVDCCEICFSLVPKELSLEHKGWHLRQEEGLAR